MGIQKMSLANIKGKLSRAEMKNIMAGSGSGGGTTCSVTCSTGYYACCCSGDCQCHPNYPATDYGCTSGGPGATSCSA